VSSDLVVNPCQKQCRWRPAERRHTGERLFHCTSCGSQWVPSQPWAPVDADGSRAPELLAALEQRDHHS
jgi:hypothetical protein